MTLYGVVKIRCLLKVEDSAESCYVMHTHNPACHHRHARTCLFPRKIEPYSLFIEVLPYSNDIHSLMALWLGCCEARRCYFWKIVYQLKANSAGLLSNVLDNDWLWLQRNMERELKVHCCSFTACSRPFWKQIFRRATSNLQAQTFSFLQVT